MLENYSIASVEERLINLVENEVDFTVFCQCCVSFVLPVDNRENKSTTNSEVSPSCWVNAYEVFPSKQRIVGLNVDLSINLNQTISSSERLPKTLFKASRAVSGNYLAI